MRIDLDWLDVKSAFIDLAQNGHWPVGRNDRSAKVWANELRDERMVTFSGGTVEDTSGWLTDGYRTDVFKLNALETAPRERKRFRYSEEDGDLDIGRLLGGSDDVFLERTRREAKVGLTLEVELGFTATARPAHIAEYGAWVTSLIGALEDEGYDLACEIVNTSQQVFTDKRGSHSVHITVKRQNEVSDFTSWSALFAPTGHRHIMFTAKRLAADKAGATLAGGFGASTFREGWRVARKDSHTIRIGCNASGGSCTDKLNADARALDIVQ